MNPLMIMAAIGVGVVGLSMLMRKTNAAVQWVQEYWAGRATLPADFHPTPEQGFAQIVNDGTVSVGANNIAQVRCLIGAQVSAADDGVVVSMNPIPGRLGQIMGLSHLSRRGESSLYVGVMPTVGLGQIVRKGLPLGDTDIDRLSFAVCSAAIPSMSAPKLNLAQWCAIYNVSITPGA
jgi:hypothetical protein